MGDFRKLRVWQQACAFADEVELMAKSLPTQQRRYALDQLVPAAHSIHENLAEGCGFGSDRQLLKYARQALSTANESEDELMAFDRKQLLGNHPSLLAEARSICAQLAKLIQKLEIDVARQGSGRKPRVVRRRTTGAASRAGKPGTETECREPTP